MSILPRGLGAPGCSAFLVDATLALLGQLAGSQATLFESFAGRFGLGFGTERHFTRKAAANTGAAASLDLISAQTWMDKLLRLDEVYSLLARFLCLVDRLGSLSHSVTQWQLLIKTGVSNKINLLQPLTPQQLLNGLLIPMTPTALHAAPLRLSAFGLAQFTAQSMNSAAALAASMISQRMLGQDEDGLIQKKSDSLIYSKLLTGIILEGRGELARLMGGKCLLLACKQDSAVSIAPWPGYMMQTFSLFSDYISAVLGWLYFF
ncbi:unnamed protein product [Protopolystoma xenopodis]|uniref:Uncharacterized protein n=1 Tax=Protopolystoma xenopodis TaxID=117903 RepID=A0A448XPX8_9PLAT|nr:unnamed protein product [Protopolystoma xenopodis]